MAYPTVADARHRADNAAAKSVSGFGERPRRWSLRKRQVETPAAPVVERSTFPQPDAPTQAIPAPRPYRQVRPSANVHGTHPAHLLFELAHRALDVCADPCTDHRAAYDALVSTWTKLQRGAASEANFDRRTKDNKQAAAAQGATLQDAARRGHDIGPKSPHGRQAVSDIVERALRAPLPESTQVMEQMTPQRLAELDAERAARVSTAPASATSAPAVAASPVRADAPPVPADEVADPGSGKPVPAPLPHRTPHLVAFEARLDGTELKDGDPVKAGDLPELLDGFGPLWLAHRGFWHRIVSARVEGPQVHVTLDGGVTDCPDVDATVHVLHDSDARVLRSGAVDQ